MPYQSSVTFNSQDFLKFANFHFFAHCGTPLVTQSLQMNNTEPPPPNDAAPQIWSKLVQPFFIRSKKCEKVNTGCI